MPGPTASIPLARLDGPRLPWREIRKALCRWQATGRAHLEIAHQPVDLVSVARATAAADLPRPSGCPPDAPFVIVVYDRKLAHDLIRLAVRLTGRDNPPPDPPPPIGSEA